MSMPTLDMEKLKNLIHYICYKTYAAHSANFGKVKLNKILWFSDAIFYMNHRRPITGETYVKGQYGPMSQNILDALRELAHEMKVLESSVTQYGYPKKEYAVLKNPDISSFTAEEISHVDEVIQRVCDNFTAAEISAFTHNDVWEAAEIGEEIPYVAVAFDRPVQPSREEIEWAKNVIDISERAHEVVEA